MTDTPDQNPLLTNKRRMRVKLIFNPGAGAARAKPIKLVDVIHELQAWNLVPEAYLVEPGCDVAAAVREALAQGIRMIVVCGGDGTISTVSSILAGTNATLGIIPIGTQNNTALSLGIPADDIPAAIAILRNGRRIKVDVGMATCGKITTPFQEACSVGLATALYESADDIQHGNLARIGDFLSTLTTTPPARITLRMDDQPEVQDLGHVVVVSNMPYIGVHYQVGAPNSYNDGLLDVLFFADLSKLELLGYVFGGIGDGKPEDERIQHYKVRRIDIDTQPPMLIAIDGFPIGEGKVRIEVRRHALTLMAGPLPPKPPSEAGKKTRKKTADAKPT